MNYGALLLLLQMDYFLCAISYKYLHFIFLMQDPLWLIGTSLALNYLMTGILLGLCVWAVIVIIIKYL